VTVHYTRTLFCGSCAVHQSWPVLQFSQKIVQLMYFCNFTPHRELGNTDRKAVNTKNSETCQELSRM